MKLDACQNLFQTPLLSMSVPDADELNTNLVSEIAALRELSEGVSRSNRNGWHSKGGLFDSGKPSLDQLSNHIRDAFLMATRLHAPNFDLEAHAVELQGWINVNPKGAYNQPHYHPNHQWSGCYYVTQPAVDEGVSGMIEFLDPRGSLSDMSILRSPYFRQSFQFRPQPGTLLVFPSYLQHWVHPNEQEEERITIAWNGRFKKRKSMD